jgi:polyhydroxyalkanoate synthesis regulator phasin
MLKDNPVMKKLVATGEERVGRLVQQLMSNEKFVAGVQTIIKSAFTAKGTMDKSLRTALAAMNLPSTADVELLKEKVDELEALLESIEGKLEQLAPPKR